MHAHPILVASATTPPPARVNLAELVYATLKAELHDFRWVPGDRLSESEVGVRLGVSRTPVREALFRLRNEGLLEVESKSGWFVRPIDFGRLDQLYDLRIVLESASVERLLLAEQLHEAPALQALQRVWLVPVGERLADADQVALSRRSVSRLARAALPATTRWRACTRT